MTVFPPLIQKNVATVRYLQYLTIDYENNQQDALYILI